MPGWMKGWRLFLAAAALAVVTVVVFSLGASLLFRARFAPRQIEALDLIEQRTGWRFPADTRIASAAQGHLGMDFAIWAVLEIPQEHVRELLATPPADRDNVRGESTGEFAYEEGQGQFPAICRHMDWGYWSFAPDWIPPLPERFERYAAAYRFAHGSYDVREAIAELGDEGSAMATVYVFYATY